MPVFCEALARSLGRSGFDVAGWATDEREAANLADRTEPHIVLTEVELDVGSGMRLARRLGERTRVILLTRHDIGDVLLDAVAAGAVGCLGHGVDVSGLAACLDVDGSWFVHRADELLPALRRAVTIRGVPANVLIASLTTREREVLRLLSEGLDDDAIARGLYLSPNTVRTHVGRALRKLDVHSRADATRVFLAAGAGPDVDTVTRIRGPSLESR